MAKNDNKYELKDEKLNKVAGGLTFNVGPVNNEETTVVTEDDDPTNSGN